MQASEAHATDAGVAHAVVRRGVRDIGPSRDKRRPSPGEGGLSNAFSPPAWAPSRVAPRSTPDKVRDEALASAKILNASQRHNARLKCDDLTQGHVVWDSVPFRLILETNRRCNLRCVMCDNVHTGNGELAPWVVEKLFAEIGWGTMEIQPFGAGEPTLSPMSLLAPIARRYNNYFNFITNGVLFTREYYEDIADITGRVQFSIHSHRREIAQRIAHGQDFDLVVRNLRDAVRIAEDTGAHIVASQVVMDTNLDGLPDYVRFVADLGVRRILFSRLYPTSSAYAEHGIEVTRGPAEIDDIAQHALEVALEHGIYLESNFEAIVHDPRNHPHLSSPFDVLHENAHIVELYRPDFCISTAITVFIEWDGTVLPCFQHRIPLGNLYEQSFGEIWNGPAMQRHRRTFLERDLQSFCSNCQRFFCDHA